MSLIFRLAGQKLGSPFLRNERNGLLSFVRPLAHQTTCSKVESHDERNMRLKRPQSPHLTIYAPQLTSLLSFIHRTTGIILSTYTIGFGLAAVVLPESIPDYLDNLACAEVGSVAIMALKFILVAPLAYHFWNGIRHLLWDLGLFLTLKQVYITGYSMLVLALCSTIAVILM